MEISLGFACIGTFIPIRETTCVCTACTQYTRRVGKDKNTHRRVHPPTEILHASSQATLPEIRRSFCKCQGIQLPPPAVYQLSFSRKREDPFKFGMPRACTHTCTYTVLLAAARRFSAPEDGHFVPLYSLSLLLTASGSSKGGSPFFPIANGNNIDPPFFHKHTHTQPVWMSDVRCCSVCVAPSILCSGGGERESGVREKGHSFGVRSSGHEFSSSSLSLPGLMRQQPSHMISRGKFSCPLFVPTSSCVDKQHAAAFRCARLSLITQPLLLWAQLLLA